MAEPDGLFSDGAAYERFIGPWSLKVGAAFLDWLEPPSGLRWLEVGCGTGVFTELLLDRCAPREVIPIDPAPAQIEEAGKKPVARRAAFRVADAQELPFADAAFDLAVSALVINFIPDRARALVEMKRVVRPGGLLAGYVWDFTGAIGSPSAFVNAALRGLGFTPQALPGAESTTLDALNSLFEAAGLEAVEVRPFEVTHSYANAEEWWTRFIENPTAQTAFIRSLGEADRRKIRAAAEALLPVGGDGTVTFPSRAHAAKGRVPSV